MASELKPCPFCGENNLDTYYCDIEGWIAHIKCLDCDDMIGPMSEFKYETQEEAYEDASKRWNTRPAPAATDTGLETVAQVYINNDGECEQIDWLYFAKPEPDFIELVTRSQAEELLAAERDKVIVQTKRAELAELKERWLKEMVASITSNPIGSPKHFRAVEDARRALNNPEASLYALYEKEELIQRAEKAEADNAALIHDLTRIKDHETELVNDNAAKAARIKALVDENFRLCELNAVLMGDDEDKPRYTTKRLKQEIARATEALEAKLATAQKALEPFAKIPVSTVPEGRLGHVPDKHPYMVDLDGNVLFTASDIRKARAVLEGEPS